MTIALLLVCISLTLLTLIALTIIDLKTRLLPNTYVALFALLGIVFNILTDFAEAFQIY